MERISRNLLPHCLLYQVEQITGLKINTFPLEIDSILKQILIRLFRTQKSSPEPSRYNLTTGWVFDFTSKRFTTNVLQIRTRLGTLKGDEWRREWKKNQQKKQTIDVECTIDVGMKICSISPFHVAERLTDRWSDLHGSFSFDNTCNLFCIFNSISYLNWFIIREKIHKWISASCKVMAHSLYLN